MEFGQKVKIISDSTCDLSQELTAKYDIDILPLHILLGENEFRDGKDTTPDRIFAWADANKATPKTSAPSLEDAKALLQPYVEAGREVICFSISGSMSTSGNVMRLAAEELDAAAQVTIIDSENLSTGIGLLVLEAAIMAEQGAYGGRDHRCRQETHPEGAGKLCRGYIGIPVARRAMQCRCRFGRQCVAAAPQDRGGKRRHAGNKEVPRENGQCD